jgi:hypothetical protein
MLLAECGGYGLVATEAATLLGTAAWVFVGSNFSDNDLGRYGVFSTESASLFLEIVFGLKELMNA